MLALSYYIFFIWKGNVQSREAREVHEALETEAMANVLQM